MKLTKQRIFEIIQIGERGDAMSRGFDYILSAVILINIAVLFVASFPLAPEILATLRVIELVTILFFCVEYALRIWTADCLFPEKSRTKAVLRFLVSFDGIVDLLTILPFFFLSGAVVFRMLRVVRIFHLFRINSRYDSFNVIVDVLKETMNQIISSVFIILTLMLASSLTIYNVEHEVQPEVCSNAFSG